MAQHPGDALHRPDDEAQLEAEYRTAIAWQNTAYNQPPHPSFYLGGGMSTPPQPNVYLR